MSVNDKSFIEVQFPVSKVSKESYKERKAGSNQTLTGLGKWWGRKPLILVRAAILGLLMPASSDPKMDRGIFLKILSMDNKGLITRKNKQISTKDIFDGLTPREREEYFEKDRNGFTLNYKKGITKEDKDRLQAIVFNRLSYDKKLTYCLRTEELNELPLSTMKEINQYLSTNATSILDLVEQLGIKKFGRKPILGDCFCGGGSIPFEAGRIGCDVYASDLNPLAGLLTWAGLSIINRSNEEIKKLKDFQEKVYDAVAKQVEEWGIEDNESGWKAKYYLYCNEATCPECGVKVPLSPNWIVSESFNTVAKLTYNPEKNNFDIEIKSNASKEEMKIAKDSATIKNYNLHCPHCDTRTPINVIRKDKEDEIERPYRYNIPNALRKWGKLDFLPSVDDIYSERLYCIKYIDKFENKTWEEVMKKPAPATDACYGTVHYVSPTDEDIKREQKVIKLLGQKFEKWQNSGFIPDVRIEEGWNTNQVRFEKGWTYWHHLFNPRQLLINGLFAENINDSKSEIEKAFGILALNKSVYYNSKLCIWDSSGDKGQQTFTNQALNTLFNYPTRALSSIYTAWIFEMRNYYFNANANIQLKDAREVDSTCDIWVTDPPYADAVHYHELSEFFLAWDEKLLRRTFPNWYTDTKRALAVKGTGEYFNQSMIEIYRNLAYHMTDDGMQIVMFTHQSVSVWAELTMILWSAGLRVSAAWNIATETESGGLKDGNYVKGTVLLVLQKQVSEDTAYLDELYPEIEEEVKRQIDSMRDLDDKDDPNFTDADYLLAAYAASLKVLTSYNRIEDIDISYELSKTKSVGEVSPIENIINEAVKIAYDYLIPTGFDSYTWKMLTPEERFYIKGLDLEKADIYQVSAYQELARGFGVKEYKDLLGSTKANQARLRTATEFGLKGMSDSDRFGSSLLRNILAALHQSIKEEDTIAGKNWLKNEVPNYWMQRNTIIEILDYISTLGHIENMPHWEQEANYANMLKERIKDDSI